MSEQHDNQLAESMEAKRLAMDQVETNANRVWLDFMFEIVWLTCHANERFTTDDVMELYGRAINRDKPTTHELRAMGPVMLRAAKAGFCRKADCKAVPSRRKSLHASPRAVWQSLIYEAPT